MCQNTTIEELAELLDVYHHDPEGMDTEDLVLSMIHRVPEAQAIWEVLTKESTEGPTLLSLAGLYYAASKDKHSRAACRSTALWLVQRDPGCAEQWKNLEQIRKDLGGDQRHYFEFVWFNEKFELLLSAGQWEEPEDVLDPDRTKGVPYDELLRISRARLSRETDKRKGEHLQQVHSKLEKYSQIMQPFGRKRRGVP